MLARIRKCHTGETLPPVPVVVAASDDVEAELARLSALLGVTNGQLARLQRIVEEACDQVCGYSEEPDGGITVKFRSVPPLVALLAASLDLREADATSPVDVVELVPPECTR